MSDSLENKIQYKYNIRYRSIYIRYRIYVQILLGFRSNSSSRSRSSSTIECRSTEATYRRSGEGRLEVDEEGTPKSYWMRTLLIGVGDEHY